MNFKEFAIDFIEDKVSVNDFIKKVNNDDGFYNWFQSIIPADYFCTKSTILRNGEIKYETIPYDVRFTTNNYYKKQNLENQLNLISDVQDVMRGAYPNDNFKMVNKAKEVFCYLLNNCPSYIGGVEAEEVLEKIYYSIENPQTKQGKMQFKNSVKEKFKFRNKKPNWIQEPEWPIDSKGQPMEFVGESKLNKEKKEFEFYDYNTKKSIIITQIF